MQKEVSKDLSHAHAVVLAGGAGTRLWPLSRKDLPKQMQSLVSDRSLIDETVSRLEGVLPRERIFVSTTKNYAEKIMEILPNLPKENIIVEPVARGKIAALALAASTIQKRNKQAMMFVLASDHTIADISAFQKSIRNAFSYINSHPRDILLVGITPTKPDTGLGYIKRGHKASGGVSYVEKFIEKPSERVAKHYVESKEYLWNTSYYCMRTSTLLQVYGDADPTITSGITAYLKRKQVSDFLRIPDKAHEMEFLDPTRHRLMVMRGTFSWADVGTWESLHHVLMNLNKRSLMAKSGRHVDVASTDSLVVSTADKLVATVGLKNVVVVNTPDVLLVLNKEHAHDIKKLLATLKNKGMSKYL
ncbi:MAG: hypothetical protein A3J54_01155 [Candidatus Ryanbacteria bacterium RIFCSPHIGHO2_02_FULL_45_13b]|uniref:Nucleotidyl transferase domain-containing protein n=1 Tax=Candidatus Ryanbacteria bacterium RIFCSPHIGHO2_02_FULL_45_13b TaxID=1802117 RepID=A0A1G2G8U0_9BACT|nr:MAG: hypothetical protein A3J54_01155 [Candidatus Ryanbacteria bacterium RIFCSPHIGHO2_02_FULL_45_13b]